MSARIAALAAALLALVLAGCNSAPSTPLPPDTVAVVAGQPITHDEFLVSREQVVHNVRRMKQNIEPDSEHMIHSGGEFRDFTLWRIEVIERHGVDTAALAGLISEHAVWAAAVAAGYEVSDEEVAESIAEQRALIQSNIESARREIESGQSDPGVHIQPSAEEMLSEYEAAVAEAGGEEALWEKAAPYFRRSMTRGRFLDAEFQRIAYEEYISRPVADIRATRAAIAAAEVVLTGDPSIETTPEEALAYLEEYWVYEIDSLHRQWKQYATPSR